MDTQKIIDALKRLDIPEYHHLSNEEKEDGYRQMCQDLSDLADRDGCVAAAFALSVFNAIAENGVAPELLEALKGLINVKVRPHDLTAEDIGRIIKAKFAITKAQKQSPSDQPINLVHQALNLDGWDD